MRISDWSSDVCSSDLIDCLHSHVLCSFLVTARAVCVPVYFEAFHVRIAGCCFVGITVIRRGPVTFRAFAAFALLPFHAGLLQSDLLLESRCSPVQDRKSVV